MAVGVSPIQHWSLDPAQYAVERGLELSGDDAASWLSGCGLHLRSGASTLRVLADRVTSEDFVAARVWHTPGEFRFGAARRVTLFTCAIGEYVLKSGDRQLSGAQAGDGIIVTDAEWVLRAHRPAAMFLVQTTGSRLPVSTVASLDAMQARSYEGAMRDALLGAINSLFNTDPPASTLSLAAWRRAVESLVAAMVESHNLVSVPQVSQAYARLLVKALSMIESHARDPEFSVARLASALNVSRGHLHEVFAATGMSAGLHLRRTRAIIAQNLIEANSVGDRDVEQIARESGFGSVRTMRRALDWLASS